MNLEAILQQKFGLEGFRAWQEEIIQNVLQKKDTLVFMPTWGGKSLIYQFSWVCLEGLVIVISPLISLMKDQVDKLNERWLGAVCVNSSISSGEKSYILQKIAYNSFDQVGDIKFLYIAPERLWDDAFLSVIAHIKIACIAIDEAHCISQWGHDFRPSYLKIKDFIAWLRRNTPWVFPVIALTATATKKVRKDIVERLWVSDYKTFTSWFDRKNLVYIVREITKEQEKMAKILEIVQKTPPYGIIYCSSVKNVSKVYQYLLEAGVKVWIYNGEMKSELRETEQNTFMNDGYDVMVATNAFGMGIDKKDIRYVIHYNLPGSIENYYQEAGRAGRDGKMSYSIIIASYQDTIIQEFFIENSYPPKEEVLQLYDYFYKDFQNGAWAETQILKTYNTIAIESGIKNDMRVGSIIKLMEKYNIVKRGIDQMENDFEFRGRGIVLQLGKYPHSEIPILWHHQNILKDEAYFKLEQVKKMLFKPWCRKRFILEYFQDEGDLKTLTQNCGMCDYCIDKKKFQSWPQKEVVPHNVFLMILQFVKRFDDKFWVQLLAGILQGSNEKKILEWKLDEDNDYGILEIYTKDMIVSMFEELLFHEFLYKSFGQFPKIGLTQKGLETIYDNKLLLSHNDAIQSSLYVKLKSLVSKNLPEKEKSKSDGTLKIKIEKKDTYEETLKLYWEKMTLEDIAQTRQLWLQTIQWHMVYLYQVGKISLLEMMKFSSLWKLKEIKELIQKEPELMESLSQIKSKCSAEISYFDIKIALALLEKNDL